VVDIVERGLAEAKGALEALLSDRGTLELIAEAGRLMADTFSAGGTVLSCGNGGSLCDAMHFAEECSGRYRRDRRPLPALAASDASHLSCCANDFGWDSVFSRFVEAHGREGGLLLAISTSGESANVLAAARAARARGMRTVALTGRRGCALAGLADLAIATPAGPYSDHVQELHAMVIHLLVQMVERSLFPELYRGE